MVREEVPWRGSAGPVDGQVDGVAPCDVGGEALVVAYGLRRECAGDLGGEERESLPLGEGARVVAVARGLGLVCV